MATTRKPESDVLLQPLQLLQLLQRTSDVAKGFRNADGQRVAICRSNVATFQTHRCGVVAGLAVVAAELKRYRERQIGAADGF